MVDDKNASTKDTRGNTARIRVRHIPVLVALIASFTSLGIFLLTYFMIDRVRNDLSTQTLELERIKVDIAMSSQRTSEMLAKIDGARFQLETRIAASTEQSEKRKAIIEDQRSQIERLRITPDVVKLSHDLRPNITGSCKQDRSVDKVIRAICKFENHGIYKVMITPMQKVSMSNAQDAKEYKGISGALLDIDNNSGFLILPGGNVSNTYKINLTEYGNTVKHLINTFEFKAVTDQVAIAMSKRLAKGLITDDELSAISEQSFTIHF